ncbi:unnamed protein product [Angiostrongylus costaricensis]|uniref:Anti_prolifrtn domain-containing protein n=1 Tax=Angiostrongylus costaricensis TaxID=334426 RepID=A0A158PGU4_ANGCS|nr:unnamed protein product [Angiostrongylus costaricensis]
MFIEIEETVCFIASFLYGKIPKSSTELFIETLANGLVDWFYTGSRQLKSYSLAMNVDENMEKHIEEAASSAYISRSELAEILPANLLIEICVGSVYAVNTESGHVKCVYPKRDCVTVGFVLVLIKLKQFLMSSEMSYCTGHCALCRPVDTRRHLHFRVEFAYPSGNELDGQAFVKPNFKVQRCEKVYTAQTFAATRFGSAKFKTYKSSDGYYEGDSHHPFTMPSNYGYSKLFGFLNAVSRVTPMVEKNDKDTDAQGAIVEFSEDEKARLMKDTQGESTANEIVDYNAHRDSWFPLGAFIHSNRSRAL